MINDMESKVRSFLENLDRSSRTIFAYQNALNQFVAVVGNEAQLNLESYVEFLKSIKSKSPSTKRVYTTAVRKFYVFHKAWNSDELREATEHYTRAQGKRIVNFNREAIEKVIAYCVSLNNVPAASPREKLEALRDRAFLLTLADTGLRISEACSLKRGDIDWLEQRSIIIGKGDKQAIVYYSNRSIEALREYLHERSSVEPNSRTPLASQPLFARHDIRASKRIRPISAGGMWKAIKGDPNQGLVGRIEEAGVDRSLVRIHDFRHYFVTMTYLAKGDLKISQVLARHESIATTNRYAHFNNEAAKAYDEIFNRKTE
jgi:site-specific recombinase XerD